MDQIESCVPPGFRFHPTEEELVGYYLERKVNSLKFDIDVIVDIDLYRMEPWDIEDKCNLGYNEQNEWYFFSHKDRKYPTGTRTNRATTAGFWKATGRDKAVLSKDRIIGMRKTLVYYKGRAPNGRKSDWIMHEYRLQTSDHAPPQEEGWVVCRAFKKPSPSHRQGYGANWNHQNCNYYGSMRYNNVNDPNRNIDSPLISSISSPNYTDNHSLINQSTNAFQLPQNHSTLQSSFGYLQEQEFSSNSALENELITELPPLDSPTLSTKEFDQQHNDRGLITNNCYDSNLKWEVLLGSELMQEASLSSSYCNELDPHHNDDLGSFLGCFPDL